MDEGGDMKVKGGRDKRAADQVDLVVDEFPEKKVVFCFAMMAEWNCTRV